MKIPTPYLQSYNDLRMDDLRMKEQQTLPELIALWGLRSKRCAERSPRVHDTTVNSCFRRSENSGLAGRRYLPGSCCWLFWRNAFGWPAPARFLTWNIATSPRDLRVKVKRP